MKSKLLRHLDGLDIDEEIYIRNQKEISDLYSRLSASQADVKRLTKKIKKYEQHSVQSDSFSKKFRRFARKLSKVIRRRFGMKRPSGFEGGPRVEVTVVIPTFRETDYAYESIDSVLRQKNFDAFSVLVVVNCGNTEWRDRLLERYGSCEKVEIAFIEGRGAAAARNYAIAHVQSSHVLFLDDDDYLTSGYLKAMHNATASDSDMVFGPFDSEGDNSETYSYTDGVLKHLEKSKKKRASLVGAFSGVAGRLLRVSYLKKCQPFRENLSHSEDVLFWIDNWDLLRSKVMPCSANCEEAYVRRVVPDSLSRPGESREYSFYVTDRIDIILSIESVILNGVDNAEYRRFLLNVIKAQSGHMFRYFNQCTPEKKKSIREEVEAYSGLFINKGDFSDVSAVAFCHNFSPSSDPSAFVATKRLRQIDEEESCQFKWFVVSQDMQNIRTLDKAWDVWYAQFACSDHIILRGAARSHPSAQIDYALRAFRAVRSVEAKVVYSRTMFPGSHLAAYLYKKEHPETIWYAEFSDPIHIDSRGHIRDKDIHLSDEDLLKYEDFFESCELIPYAYADHIVFTNEVQKTYMLDYCADKELCERAKKISKVWSHPIIDPRFVHLQPSKYVLDETKINIGYFGSFYARRKASDLFSLLDRQDVVLHLFVPDPRSGEVKDIDHPRVVINSVKPYFEFLDLAARMDYVLLADMQSLDGCVPWLPSKLSDYRASGTPIIAKCIEGSPLSLLEDKNIIQVKQIDEKFLSTLRKKAV